MTCIINENRHNTKNNIDYNVCDVGNVIQFTIMCYFTDINIVMSAKSQRKYLKGKRRKTERR
jgi:hypothetical protein